MRKVSQEEIAQYSSLSPSVHEISVYETPQKSAAEKRNSLNKISYKVSIPGGSLGGLRSLDEDIQDEALQKAVFQNIYIFSSLKKIKDD